MRKPNGVIAAGIAALAFLVIGLYAGWKIRNGTAMLEAGRLNIELQKMTDEIADLAIRFERAWRQLPILADEGVASWYGPGFHGKVTANGETYDQDAWTVASPDLPLGAVVLVENVDNDLTCVARVTDRGPYIKGRVIDLSRAVAERLGVTLPGVARVRVYVIPGPQPSKGDRP